MSKYCLKCSGRIPLRTVIEGRVRNLCSRKYCIECSPFGKHNTRKVIDLKPYTKFCNICGNTCPNRRNTCSSCSVLKFRRKRKVEAVKYKGGCCCICGYSKCIGALEFHHRDRSDKEYSPTYLWQLSWEKVIKELDKCDLVCSNCHAEIEHKYQIDNVKRANVSSFGGSVTTAAVL